MAMTLLASFLVVMELPSSILAQTEPDDINYGPGFLHVRSQSPGQSLRMTMPEVLPGSIRPGISLMFNVTNSNIWAEDEFVFFDYEILDTSVGITYGFNERLGLAFFYDQRDYWGDSSMGSLKPSTTCSASTNPAETFGRAIKPGSI
jgi:hypothetical protein